MATKLKILVPPVWEQWAERRRPFIGDPERPQALRDAVRLPSPSGRSYRLWLPSGHIIRHPVRGGSRLFDDASTQFLENTASAPVTASPFTMAGWGNSNDATVDQAAIQIQDKDVGNHHWKLQWQGATAGDPLRFISRSNLATATIDTTSGFTAGTWHHGAAVETSAINHTVYIDGGSDATITTSVTPTGMDSISIGRAGDSTPDAYFSGDLAEVAVWDVAFTAPQMALLAKAVSPLLVRPEALVFYCPIIGRYSPEIDVVGGRDMTVTGAVASAHPRIFYPSMRSLRITPSAPAATKIRDVIGRGVVPFKR